MKRKTLYALALLLFLSSVAFSNERARFRCRTAGDLPCTNATRTPGATSTPSAIVAESHLLLHAFIKLLYI